MGNTNTLPVVSQVKSTVQLITGDPQGALETQKQFAHESIISPITAGVYLVKGKREKAGDTLAAGGRTLLHTIEGIPVAGHITGIIHYARGDNETGHRAMNAASRTTAVVGGGVAGVFVGGPVGAVMGGIAAGTTYDCAHSLATDTKQGIVGAVDRVVDAARYDARKIGGAVFDLAAVPTFDGVAGFAAGNTAQNVANAIATRQTVATAAASEAGAATASETGVGAIQPVGDAALEALAEQDLARPESDVMPVEPQAPDAKAKAVQAALDHFEGGSSPTTGKGTNVRTQIVKEAVLRAAEGHAIDSATSPSSSASSSRARFASVPGRRRVKSNARSGTAAAAVASKDEHEGLVEGWDNAF